MRIYFSGGGSSMSQIPEVLVPERKPHVMLTFHDINKGQTVCVKRIKAYIKRKKEEQK